MDPKALKIMAIPDHETNNLIITEFELNLNEDDLEDLWHKISLARMGPPNKETGTYKLKYSFQ